MPCPVRDEGLVDLDDPVSDYFPDVPNGENITVEQLLTMRSGLYDYSTTLLVNQTMDDDPGKAWDPTELVEIGVVEDDGRPGPGFGRPQEVYLEYCRRRGDRRGRSVILDEAESTMAEVRGRGVFLAEGYGERPWELEASLDERVRFLYRDSKECLFAELPESFADNWSA